VNHSDVDTDILVFKSNGGEMWIKGEQESVEEMFIQKVQVREVGVVQVPVAHEYAR
jgi:hypothetical protein